MSISEANVEIPTTLSVSEILVISNSVRPSTSKSPLASILFAKVAIPTTFSVSLILVISNSVLPSTSRSALASILPVKVESPLTTKEVKSPCDHLAL